MKIGNIEMTDEEISKVEKLIEIRNKGYYASGQDVVSLYNKMFNKHQNVTQCSSCLRNYIAQMEAALNHAKELEKREAEKKAAEEMKDKMAKVREARKKKED